LAVAIIVFVVADLIDRRAWFARPALAGVATETGRTVGAFAFGVAAFAIDATVFALAIAVVLAASFIDLAITIIVFLITCFDRGDAWQTELVLAGLSAATLVVCLTRKSWFADVSLAGLCAATIFV
jgi:hypothetical protein